jgi:MinD superfamily P-loop ATPase
MKDGRPNWEDRCELCFACFNWCPKNAVQAGTFTLGKPRYHHPEIKINQIISQKTIN